MGVQADFKAFYNSAKSQQNHMHRELPYRYFDKATMLFQNAHSKGFGFKLSVLGGANDELVQSFNNLVMDLPQGPKWDYQLTLFGSNQVGHLIDANEEHLSVRGGISAALSKKQATYAKYAARNGFFHQQKHHFDLRDYSAYVFVSSTCQDEQDIVEVRESLMTSLTQIGLSLSSIDQAGLITYVEDIVNFDPNKDRPSTPDYNPYDPLNVQMMASDSEFLINRKHIAMRHTNSMGKDVQSRAVSLGLRLTPSHFRLYAFPECFASLRNISKSVPCPHLLSFNFRCEDSGKEQADNDRKISTLNELVTSPMRLLLPTASDELEERQSIQKDLANKKIGVGRMVLTLTLFTDKVNERKHVQAAKESFGGGGLSIAPILMLQSQAFLSSLPFMMSEGFWKDCENAGRIRKMKSSNLVSFFPLVLDYKNFSGGMLLPTMRQQISFFDPFNCGSDNFNIALTGGSGAGKSVFVQEVANVVYSKGGKVWILDKGGSYKKLTLMLGGVYMTPKDIFLNPFTHLNKVSEKQDDSYVDEEGVHIDPLAEALDNITALFASIASPREELSTYQTSVLGDAIITAWEANGTQTLVDDVQAALFDIAKQDQDRRIKDLAVQLNKYCSGAIYGDVFNKPSMLDPDVHITTLELDGFPEAILRPAMFALMVAINQQMYLSGSRSTPKMCIIEEAWSLLSGSNAQARKFINTGYRTARKFGGSFCTVTQGIKDFFDNPEAEACYNNSDIHIVLRQGEGFSDFLQENPKKFTEWEQHIITNFNKSSEAGYSCAMVKAGGHTSFHRFFCDPYKRACYSTEANEYEYCENLMKAGHDVMSAIDATAQHFYGEDIERFNSEVYGEGYHA